MHFFLIVQYYIVIIVYICTYMYVWFVKELLNYCQSAKTWFFCASKSPPRAISHLFLKWSRGKEWPAIIIWCFVKSDQKKKKSNISIFPSSSNTDFDLKKLLKKSDRKKITLEFLNSIFPPFFCQTLILPRSIFSPPFHQQDILCMYVHQ